MRIIGISCDLCGHQIVDSVKPLDRLDIVESKLRMAAKDDGWVGREPEHYCPPCAHGSSTLAMRKLVDEALSSDPLYGSVA